MGRTQREDAGPGSMDEADDGENFSHLSKVIDLPNVVISHGDALRAKMRVVNLDTGIDVWKGKALTTTTVVAAVPLMHNRPLMVAGNSVILDL